MNKIIFILSTILIFTSQIQAKPWWKTALVDASGALGGGAAVVSFTGGAATLTPLGWTAVGGGAILGGAGASIGYAGMAKPNAANGIDNPNNPMDFVGKYHNLLVRDFYTSGSTYSSQTFLEFASANKTTYGIDENIYITTEFLDAQEEEIHSLTNDEEVMRWVLNKLPIDVPKDAFVSFMTEVRDQTSKKNAINAILNFENATIENKTMDSNSKNYILIFLSTFRNSTVLWYN